MWVIQRGIGERQIGPAALPPQPAKPGRVADPGLPPQRAKPGRAGGPGLPPQRAKPGRAGDPVLPPQRAKPGRVGDPVLPPQRAKPGRVGGPGLRPNRPCWPPAPGKLKTGLGVGVWLVLFNYPITQLPSYPITRSPDCTITQLPAGALRTAGQPYPGLVPSDSEERGTPHAPPAHNLPRGALFLIANRRRCCRLVSSSAVRIPGPVRVCHGLITATA